MYERQDGTGLEIGSYAHRSIVHDPEEIPSVEAAALSPTEFPFTQADFDPQLADALDLMPEIVGDESVGVKYAINGLISLTPDGMPILGETPEVKGLWSAAAVWVKEGPGVGKSLAEWMVHGESHIDLHSSDVARFHDHQKTRSHVKARTTEAFPKTYGIIHPAEQWASDRNLRLSPMHEQQKELGAVFFEAAGWERPQWYEANAQLVERYGVEPREAEWDARWWSPIINAEHLAMREHAGIFDLSAFAIFDVCGAGALDALQRSVLAQMDVGVGRVVYTPVLSPGGGFRSDLTIMRLGDEEFRIVTGGAHGMADRKLFCDQLPDDGSASLVDVTTAWTTIGLWGPRARDILSSVTSDDVSHEGFPFGTCRTVEIGSQLALASRISYVGDLGWELYVPSSHLLPPLGHAVGGGAAARADRVRDRRLRHHRSPREVLPRLRCRARERVHGRRGGDAATQGQGAGLRREGRASAPPRRRARGDPLHAHGRRSHLGERRQALPPRARAHHLARWHAAHRREGTALVRDQRWRGPVARQVCPHELPAARARGRGIDRPRRRVHDRAVPRDGRRGRCAADLRSREHADSLVRILVCVKRVPMTGGTIVLTDDERAIETRHLGFTISPHEECGVEEAVRLVEAHGGESVVLTLGTAEAEEQLRDAMAIGADRAIHVVTDEQEWDPQATASAILDAIRDHEAANGPFDLVVFGNESADAGNFQVGIRIAHALGRPVATGLKALTVENGTVRCEQEVPGGRDVYALPLPAVVTVKEGLNLPRYPSVPGKLRAQRKPVERRTPERLAPRLEMTRLVVPEGEGKHAEVLGEGASAAPRVVEVLREIGVLG